MYQQLQIAKGKSAAMSTHKSDASSIIVEKQSPSSTSQLLPELQRTSVFDKRVNRAIVVCLCYDHQSCPSHCSSVALHLYPECVCALAACVCAQRDTGAHARSNTSLRARAFHDHSWVRAGKRANINAPIAKRASPDSALANMMSHQYTHNEPNVTLHRRRPHANMD